MVHGFNSILGTLTTRICDKSTTCNTTNTLDIKLVKYNHLQGRRRRIYGRHSPITKDRKKTKMTRNRSFVATVNEEIAYNIVFLCRGLAAAIC